MTHATFWAIQVLLGVDDASILGSGFTPSTQACDWGRIDWDEPTFGATNAMALSSMHAAHWKHQLFSLPTCPKCAVFVDMALELRNEE